jgi:hypothetical protein
MIYVCKNNHVKYIRNDESFDVCNICGTKVADIVNDMTRIHDGGQEMSEGEIKLYVRNEEEENQLGKREAGRFSEGKIRYDLVAPFAMEQIAKVYTYGTIKYDDDNWWKGLSWKKNVLGCIFRHVWAWVRGEKWDPESGLHHLAHAAWNCMTLIEYEKHGIGRDDRVPYTLDLMDEKERQRRISMWRKLAVDDKMYEYNGLHEDLPF